jgi:hypothetical protein
MAFVKAPSKGASSRRQIERSVVDRRSLMKLTLVLGLLATACWSARADEFEMPMVNTPARPQDTEVATSMTLPKAALSPSAVVSLSERRNTVLRGTSKTIKFPLPGAAAKGLESVGSEMPNAPGLELVLDGVRLTNVGLRDSVVYNVYVNLPRSSPSEAATEPIQDHYLGEISSFALAEHKLHSRRGARLVIPLDPLIGALRAKGSWSPDQLEIHFVPAGALGVGGPLVEIESVRVELGPKGQ